MTATDVLSDLPGSQPGSALAHLRAQRTEATNHAQGSYRALFDADGGGDLSRVERLAAALRAATVHLAPAATALYRARLLDAGDGREGAAAAPAT